MNAKLRIPAYRLHMVQAALVLLAVVFTAFPIMAQHNIPRSVMSAGGSTMKGASTSVDGTMSQTAIGIVRSPQRAAEQGFWYQVKRISSGNGWHTTIILPHVTGRNGETVEFPIEMRTTRRMLLEGLSGWTMNIAFNKTMLEPKNAHAVIETDSTYIVTFRGVASDTVERIALMSAFVRLGNDSTTPVTLVSFEWEGTDKMRIYSEPGSFTDLSICKAGGPRLISAISRPTLRIDPQPLIDRGQVTCMFTETTNATISLYNGDGIIVRQLYRGAVTPGRFVIPFDVGLLASGAYVISLETSTDLVGQQFMISR